MTGVTREHLEACERTVAKVIDDFGRGLSINLGIIMLAFFSWGAFLVIALK